MAIDRDTPLTRAALQQMREEMFRNYRIRNTHQKGLMHNAQWMYGELINQSIGFFYGGETAGDYFQPGVSTYTQTNSLTGSIDLDVITDVLVPTKKHDDSGTVKYAATLHVYGKNVTVKASSLTQTFVLTAATTSSYGWAHSTTQVSGWTADTPVEWYYEAKADQANPEDNTDILICAMICEWRLPVANMP